MIPGLEGVLTAVVTPFSADGGLDLAAMDGLVERQMSAGVRGIVVAGTTGESPALSEDEKRTLFLRVKVQVRGRGLVIGGAGTNNLESSTRNVRLVQECGLDAALVVTPYYNKPTPEGLARYYERIMSSVDLPLIAYNVPSRTGCDLKPETLSRLAADPRLVGVKEATGDMARAAEIHAGLGDRISLLSGDDATFLPLLACGGRGVISTSSNVDPAGMVAIHAAWARGDRSGALAAHERLLGLFRAMFIETNPGPVKYALARMGLASPVIRPPLVLPEGASAGRIDACLRSLGFLTDR